MKFSSMRYLFGQGIRNIWTNRVMSIASFCILMVSLLLVGFSVLFTANINMFISAIEKQNEMVVFLKDGLSDEEISGLEGQIKKIANVATVSFYSKEEAFDDMKSDMKGKGQGNVDILFDSLGEESPLPDAFRVKVSNIDTLSATAASIGKLQGVDGAPRVPYDFAKLFTGLRSTVAMISSAVVLALVAVSLVIISNATRASVFARRKEINIMKYVGATNGFIRIPFFVEGMFTGALAGAAAGGITWYAYNRLIEVLSEQMALWQTMGVTGFIPFDSVATKVFLYYMVAGAVLAAIGCVISTRKHLKV